ncbi:phage tail protein [Mangrovicoccus algicola]|uniref:Phage tail protein n=1 Tax=Mangrovicoccus algicola TaxID=2771008 RepID=A0A8J6YYY7_9RHOB|nr:phage tail protein [Mangrovicoccus algicola]MBE3638363.1 phage tail protein [Mangrovicoccus algicola]
MRNDPYAQYNFLLEIDGLTSAGFTEVGGITMESEIIEYREGSEVARARKLPGMMKYGNITLKRGLTQNRELWEWRKTTLRGMTERKAGAIILLDEARAPQLRWEFREGWISKYEGPALNATANEAAIESLEIVVEEVELVD